MDRFQ